jgi:hypothetical protein
VIYEQRVYRVSSGKRRGFIDFFGETVVPLLTKYGARFIGVWETEIGERNDVMAILAYKDMAERMKCWESFEKDREWNKHTSSLPQDSAYVAILKPTNYSPLQ